MSQPTHPFVRSGLAVAWLLLSACCGTGDAGPGTAASTQDPDPARTVLRAIYGERLSEHQTAQPRPAPFWRKHRLFLVTNYTWPHTPGAMVALRPDGTVATVSAVTAGLSDQHAPAMFNAIARAEQRAIAPHEAADYLHFAMQCWFGPLDDLRWWPDEASARDGTGERSTLDPAWIATEAAGHRLTVFGARHGRLFRFVATASARDGTVAIAMNELGELPQHRR